MSNNAHALVDGIYKHPDGTTFRRNDFGIWHGTDGSEVNTAYIEFRVFTDAEDAADERMTS